MPVVLGREVGYDLDSCHGDQQQSVLFDLKTCCTWAVLISSSSNLLPPSCIYQNGGLSGALRCCRLRSSLYSEKTELQLTLWEFLQNLFNSADTPIPQRKTYDHYATTHGKEGCMAEQKMVHHPMTWCLSEV